jgi:hypothetical protein
MVWLKKSLSSFLKHENTSDGRTMLNKSLSFISLAFLTVISLTYFSPALSDDPQTRVGLVIVDEDGSTRSACIVLDKAEPTGYDVLLASGIDIEATVGPLGTAVCAIDGIGCPTHECFTCQCEGGRCNYWAYYHRDGDEWGYSQLGAGSYLVEDGDIELWARRTRDNEDDPLPDIEWADVCSEEIQSSQKIETRDSNDDESDDTLLSTIGYVAFGLVAAGVIGMVAWQRLRKK